MDAILWAFGLVIILVIGFMLVLAVREGAPGGRVEITPADLKTMRALGIEDTPANRQRLAVEIARRR